MLSHGADVHVDFNNYTDTVERFDLQRVETPQDKDKLNQRSMYTFK